MTSAIKFLHDSLVQQFDQDGTQIDVKFGFKAARHVASNRVLIVPGDDKLSVGQLADGLKQVKTTEAPVLYSTWLTVRLYLDAPEARGSADTLLHLENLMVVREATFRALKLRLGNLWRREDEIYAGDPDTDGRQSHMGLILTISVLDDIVDAIPRISWVSVDGELTVEELDQEVVTDVP